MTPYPSDYYLDKTKKKTTTDHIRHILKDSINKTATWQFQFAYYIYMTSLWSVTISGFMQNHSNTNSQSFLVSWVRLYVERTERIDMNPLKKKTTTTITNNICLQLNEKHSNVINVRFKGNDNIFLKLNPTPLVRLIQICSRLT